LITLEKDSTQPQSEDIQENQDNTDSLKKKNSDEKDSDTADGLSTIFQGLVPGLEKVKIKFKPISEQFDKIVTKKKYQHMFDIVSNGFLSALNLQNPEFSNILQPEAQIYQENAHFLIPLDLQERAESNKKMQSLAIKELAPVEFTDPA
jgi:hypothetical protein